jgi:tetratricopeptide (TPR) repeat protein
LASRLTGREGASCHWLRHTRATPRRDLRAALAAIPDEQQWVQSAHESSLFLADAGLHQDARDLNVQLAEHLESAGGSESTATLASILINLGNAESGLGRHQTALATFARAADLVAGQDSPIAANVSYSTAVAHAELGQISEARACYEQALRIWDKIGGTDSDRGYVVRSLAASLARTGRSDEALVQFAEAVRLFEAVGEPDEVDLTQVGIMQARQRRGDRFSDDDISELLATAQRVPPSHRASLLHNVGNLQTGQRDLDAAAATFTSLRNWAMETGDQASAAKATASLAVVERHRGHLDSATATRPRSRSSTSPILKLPRETAAPRPGSPPGVRRPARCSPTPSRPHARHGTSTRRRARPCSRAGRPILCVVCPNHPGYFLSFPDRALNRC